MSRKHRTIVLITSALGSHSRAFCEGAADYIRNRCGWSVRLILRGDIRSAATLRAYDGVIVREIRKREYEILESCGKPVVEAAVKGTGSPRFASVDCDEKALAGLAARHFLSRGFTSLAFCGYRGVAFSDMRERYFTAAVRAAGRTVRCFPEEEGRFAEKLIEEAEPDEESFVRWVLGLPKGTGVFCANDVLAHQLLAVCMANRIKVPHDLSILGADDDFLLCNINNPSLSSISLSANGIGAGAARLLERILDGGVKGDIGRMHEEVPPGRLRVRNSTEVAAPRVESTNQRPVQIALTFDDGLSEHLSLVAPRLKKCGWKGIFNIITDQVGTTNHLTWSEIRTLKAQGFDIASHTLSHPNLAKLISDGKTNEVVRQIVESRDRIKKEIGTTPTYLCHPFVAMNEEVNRLCRENRMIPMSKNRACFGGTAKRGSWGSIGASIRRWYHDGVRAKDVLVHGITPNGGGWMPFASVEAFDDFLAQIKECEEAGLVEVVSYADFLKADE